MVKPTEEQLNSFLTESNSIEGVFSQEALESSKEAWNFAVKELEKGKPIDLGLIKGIHLRIMRELNLEIAGKFRKRPVYIVKRGEVIRECLEWQKVIPELKEWCEIWNNCLPIIKTINETGYNSESLVKDSHVHFEKIHPFADGNGRTGRILMNLQRIKLNLPILIIHAGREQQKYYEWFGKLK